MNRAVRLGFLALVLSFLLIWTIPIHAAPTLTQVHSQLTVLQDSRLQVKYRLTFVDDGSRTQITTIGPFDRGHTQIEAAIGIGPSLRLGFNPGELLDFILGWTTVDIYGDDAARQRRATPVRRALSRRMPTRFEQPDTVSE